MTTLVNELVQELIASKLSDYFANFEASQVQLKGGQVLLHDVELRRDALDALNLPLRLKSGRIGTFNLRLNLQSLISDWLSVSSMIALDSTHSCAAAEHPPDLRRLTSPHDRPIVCSSATVSALTKDARSL